MNNNGELNLVIGPMFSGKSTELLRIYNKYKRNYKIIVINHKKDTRYGENTVNTHNNDSIVSINVNNLENINIIKKINSFDIILIDEGQFFDDLYIFCKNIVDNFKKIIYIFGLSGDTNREKFGQILDIIPICDNITHLKSICNICSHINAPFTLRKTNNKDQLLVGGSDEYMAVCRVCWLSNNKRIY